MASRRPDAATTAPATMTMSVSALTTLGVGPNRLAAIQPRLPSAKTHRPRRAMRSGSMAVALAGARKGFAAVAAWSRLDRGVEAEAHARAVAGRHGGRRLGQPALAHVLEAVHGRLEVVEQRHHAGHV